MSDDARLTELLAERAKQGSGVRPTREGVEAAVGRRSRRRRRQRFVVSAVAVLCVLGGVAGGAALSGDDPERQDEPAGPVTHGLPEVPGVGLAIDGLAQQSFHLGPMDGFGEPPLSGSVFRSDETLTGPFVNVNIEPTTWDHVPEEERGDPVDLDGDGLAEGRIALMGFGVAISWPLEGGAIAGVGAVGLSQSEATAYASQLFGGSLEGADLPFPEGLTVRTDYTIPSPLGPTESTVTYHEVDDGETGDARLTVTTTNQPGWAEIRLISSRTSGGQFTDGPLGPSFLGSGQAFLSTPAEGRSHVIVLTDGGLTVEITGENVDAEVIRAALADGAFVHIEPRGGRADDPPTTTVLAPVTTTTVVTPTSVADRLRPLPDLRRTVDADGEHIVLEFDGFQPAAGTPTVLETLTGDCARFVPAFEDQFRLGGGEPDWQGWLTIELDTRFGGVEGPVFDGDGYIYCDDQAAPATIAIPIANLGEPTVTFLSGLPHIVIDIPV